MSMDLFFLIGVVVSVVASTVFIIEYRRCDSKKACDSETE